MELRLCGCMKRLGPERGWLRVWRLMARASWLAASSVDFDIVYGISSGSSRDWRFAEKIEPIWHDFDAEWTELLEPLEWRGFHVAGGTPCAVYT